MLEKEYLTRIGMRTVIFAMGNPPLVTDHGTLPRDPAPLVKNPRAAPESGSLRETAAARIHALRKIERKTQTTTNQIQSYRGLIPKGREV
jgi:hypothetical protein